jgi:two-component system catabolic regulation response regulator CreB/two-component system response regulator ChvI
MTMNNDKKKRILIVDDEHDIALAFKISLENNGFVVDTFNDPEQALSNFKAGLYDLLLIDIKMPKMNGFELYREMEKIDNKAKICFITAFEVYYKSLRELFPTVKVDCYIKKPITTDDLVQRIKSELVADSPSS